MVPQHRQSTLDTDASATQNFFILFTTSVTFEQFRCVAEFFFGPDAGAPFLWGPCSAEHAEHA